MPKEEAQNASHKYVGEGPSGLALSGFTTSTYHRYVVPQWPREVLDIASCMLVVTASSLPLGLGY